MHFRYVMFKVNDALLDEIKDFVPKEYDSNDPHDLEKKQLADLRKFLKAHLTEENLLNNLLVF